jgi:hypothetical protein
MWRQLQGKRSLAIFLSTTSKGIIHIAAISDRRALRASYNKKKMFEIKNSFSFHYCSEMWQFWPHKQLVV